MFYNFATAIVRFALLFVFRIDTKGLENIPKDSGVIFAYNHRSYWDPVIAALTAKRKLRFMAKEELFTRPILGKLIKALGAFPVKRGKGDVSMFKGALKILNDCGAMLIFPEGRRVRNGKLIKPKSGVAVIAHRAKVPVIPASISGEYKWMNKITVTYGEPVYLDFDKKLSAEELQAAANDIMDKIRANI